MAGRQRQGALCLLESDQLHDELEDSLGLSLLVDHDELVRSRVHLERLEERNRSSDVELGACAGSDRVSSLLVTDDSGG